MLLRQLLLASVLGTAALAAQAASPYNPWLADSPWSQVHGGAWQQDSTTAAGPTSAAQLGTPQFVATGLVNIAPLQSPLYPNGKRAYWGGTIDTIYKVAVVNGQLKLISSISRSGGTLSNLTTPFAGAYTAVRYDNTYLTGAKRTVLAYRDTNPGDINSPISLYKSYVIPTSVVPDPGALTPDHITGMNVLFDGKIAVVTRFGYVGVVDIENGRSYFKKVGSHSKGGLQKISNSIAVASDGGIYVVSNEEIYRFQWISGSSWATSSLLSPVDDAASCSSCWRQGYPVAEQAAGTLGDGSGSTPSLMGPNGEYVVITDGAKVANLSVYRTDTLTGGQTRLVDAIPVNFGQADRTNTASEQSVVVSGYGMAVVSNDYRDIRNIGDDIPFFTKPLINTILTLPALQNIATARVTLLGYGPRHQPWGVQKFSFDPSAGQLRSDWVRTDVSCPNAVPIMSEPSRRFYCVGAKNLIWTIESLDWDTGQNHFRKYLGVLPRYNSFYAATEIAAEGGMIYGSIDGVVYVPKQ